MDKNTMVCAAIAAAALVLALLIGLLAVWRKKRFKLIALTFDDGPSRYTETLLDGFKARHVVATFFMNGENGTGGVCASKTVTRRFSPVCGRKDISYPTTPTGMLIWPSCRQNRLPARSPV